MTDFTFQNTELQTSTFAYFGAEGIIDTVFLHQAPQDRFMKLQKMKKIIVHN